MRQNLISFLIYFLFFAIIIAITYTFNIVINRLNDFRYSDTKKISQCISQKNKVVYIDKIIYKDKVVYRDKIIYKDKVVHRDRLVYKTEPTKLTYGVSLVGILLNLSKDKYKHGFGFKVRYGEYYGQAEIISDENYLISIGYEF